MNINFLQYLLILNYRKIYQLNIGKEYWSHFTGKVSGKEFDWELSFWSVSGSLLYSLLRVPCE